MGFWSAGKREKGLGPRLARPLLAPHSLHHVGTACWTLGRPSIRHTSKRFEVGSHFVAELILKMAVQPQCQHRLSQQDSVAHCKVRLSLARQELGNCSELGLENRARSGRPGWAGVSQQPKPNLKVIVFEKFSVSNRPAVQTGALYAERLGRR